MFDLTLSNSFIIASCNGDTRGSAIESHSLYLTIHSHLLLLSLLLVGIHSHTHKYGNTALLPTYAHIHTTAPCMLPTASQTVKHTPGLSNTQALKWEPSLAVWLWLVGLNKHHLVRQLWGETESVFTQNSSEMWESVVRPAEKPYVLFTRQSAEGTQKRKDFQCES